jgi:hypothetical protein
MHKKPRKPPPFQFGLKAFFAVMGIIAFATFMYPALGLAWPYMVVGTVAGTIAGYFSGSPGWTTLLVTVGALGGAMIGGLIDGR